MKHLLRNLWIAALIVCCNFQQVSAQQLPPIPIDQDVRIGKLDNGLTYYIKKRITSAVLPTSWNTCVSTERLTSPESP